MECTQVGKLTGMVAGYYQRNGEQKWLSLKKNPKKIMSEWKPANLFEEWSNILMFVCFLRKKQHKILLLPCEFDVFGDGAFDQEKKKKSMNKKNKKKQ